MKKGGGSWGGSRVQKLGDISLDEPDVHGAQKEQGGEVGVG